MKKVLVTGSTGFVGKVLVQELVSHGYSVRALHRPTADIRPLENIPQVELVAGDVTDAESVRAAISGCEVVFHIAALFREAKHGDEEYWRVNVEGTRNVLHAADEAQVSRFLHCSTVGVHSHIPAPPATEDEEYRPGDIYQETKCEGEKLALQFFQESAMFGVVIRPAMIWGPGDTRTLKLFRGIASRRLPLIGSGKTLLHWIHVADLARAFRLAAEANTLSSGEIFIIAGEKPVTMAELYSLIAQAVGAQVLPIRIPALPLQLAGDLCELICRPLNIEPPLYRRRVDFYTKTRAFDGSKAKQLLGFTPKGNLKSEIEEIVDSYVRLGLLPPKNLIPQRVS